MQKCYKWLIKDALKIVKGYIMQMLLLDTVYVFKGIYANEILYLHQIGLHKPFW